MTCQSAWRKFQRFTHLDEELQTANSYWKKIWVLQGWIAVQDRQSKVVSPEHMHASIKKWTQQVIFIIVYSYIDVCNNNNLRGIWGMGRVMRRWKGSYVNVVFIYKIKILKIMHKYKSYSKRLNTMFLYFDYCENCCNELGNVVDISTYCSQFLWIYTQLTFR